MIILKEIKLTDFLSHKETIISLKEGDKVLIDGVSGSGKTSIIEALLWALYGRARVDNRSLVRRGAKTCEVSIVLYETASDSYYRVTREASAAGKHSVMVEESHTGLANLSEVGTGGVRDTENYIVKLLGASYQLFVNSVVFPQDGVESFVTANGIRRKELLLEILKTEALAEYSEKTKEIVTEKKTSFLTSEARLDSNIHRIESYAPRIETLPKLIVGEGVAEDAVKSAKEILEAEETKLEEVEKAYSSVSEDESKLRQLKSKVNTIKGVNHSPEDIKKSEETIKNEDDIRSELLKASEHNNELSALTSDRPQLRNYIGEMESIEKRIAKIVNETLTCPSGDECPYSKLVGPELASLKKELRDKEEENKLQNTGLRAWESKIDAFGPRIDTRKLEDELKDISRAHVILREAREFEEQKIILDEISSLESSLVNAPSIRDVDQARAVVKNEIEKVGIAEHNLVDVKAGIAHLLSLSEESKKMTEENKEIEETIAATKDEISLLEDLRDAFGPTGITAVALDYLLPSLEDKINEVLSMLSDFRVVLSTQKEGAGGGKIEGLFITVINETGEEMDFDAYSGGEKVRISVALSEALASLSKCGFRVMDEAVSALDENMVDNFLSVLSKIQSRYSQTLNISHVQSVKDTFENKVLITKLDGVSRIG